MTIEIKELVIKAVVDDGCDDESTDERSELDEAEQRARDVMRALRRAEER